MPKKKKCKKLQTGWLYGAKRKKRNIAATMIQRAYRSYQLRKAFRQHRKVVRDCFLALKDHYRIRNRTVWQQRDLHRLTREELQLMANELNIPAVGKKTVLIKRLQHWVDNNMLVNDVAGDAAAKAMEKHAQGHGKVYYCETHIGSKTIDVDTLRGKKITKVAAGFDSDALYTVDEESGAVWLCKTGGFAGQIGLCTENSHGGGFEDPLKTRWLVTPVFMHVLRAEHIIDVKVAHTHTLALARAGEIFSWGDNPHGQLGFQASGPDHVAHNRASVIAVISNYQARGIAVGSHHGIAVCDQVAGHDGVVFAWGSNTYSQLGMPVNTANDHKSSTKALLPTATTATAPLPAFIFHRLTSLQNVTIRQVACGTLHSMALSNQGKLFGWGCNDGGRLGLGHAHKVTEPKMIGGALENLCVVQVACGAWHSACIATKYNAKAGDEDGRVFTWGTGVYGQLGAGNRQAILSPQFVRLPPSAMADLEIATQLACGTYHTSVVTSKHNVYSWGSCDAFSPLATKLRLPTAMPFGRVNSIACGRNFTVFNVLSLDSQSYEAPNRPLLWRIKEIKVPPLHLNLIPPPPHKSFAHFEQRLAPLTDQFAAQEQDAEENRHVDAIDLDKLIHPLCRVCWRCNGFQPSFLKLWVCRHCVHEKELHGPRKGPLTEYEAVRKIQCAFRARQAHKIMEIARQKRFQRVFSIPHDRFFYYDTWLRKASWSPPPNVKNPLDLQIRDPDEMPHIRPPWTSEEAQLELQSLARMFLVQKHVLNMLIARYTKHFDLETETVYYRERKTRALAPKAPMRLMQRHYYDLGEPEEIKRKRRLLAMTEQDAALIIRNALKRAQAREKLKQLLLARYRKVLDPKSKDYYYFDVLTRKTTWHKPLLLGPDDDVDEFGHVSTSIAARLRKRQLANIKKNAPPKQYADENEAAQAIQNMFHHWKGRQMVLQMICLRYRKRIDKESGRAFYYDRVLKKTTWVKPLGLGEYDLEVDKDEANGQQDDDDDVHSAASSDEGDKKDVFVVGDETKELGLLESTTGMKKKKSSVMMKSGGGKMRSRHASSLVLPPKWQFQDKPKATGPKVTQRAQRRRDERHHYDKLKRLRALSRTEAAILIQKAFRMRRAKDQIYQLVLATYEKIYDPFTQRFYFHNLNTDAVSWDKPCFVKEKDILTREQRLQREQEKEAQEEDGQEPQEQQQQLTTTSKDEKAKAKEQPDTTAKEATSNGSPLKRAGRRQKPRRRRSHPITTPQEAAVVIQSVYRRYRALKTLRQVVASHLERVFDPQTRHFFYYNKVTGASSWTKPKLLLNHIWMIPKYTKKKKTYEDQASAAVAIQGVFRLRRAKQLEQIRLQKLKQQQQQQQQDQPEEHFLPPSHDQSTVDTPSNEPANATTPTPVP